MKRERQREKERVNISGHLSYLLEDGGGVGPENDKTNDPHQIERNTYFHNPKVV